MPWFVGEPATIGECLIFDAYSAGTAAANNNATLIYYPYVGILCAKSSIYIAYG